MHLLEATCTRVCVSFFSWQLERSFFINCEGVGWAPLIRYFIPETCLLEDSMTSSPVVLEQRLQVTQRRICTRCFRGRHWDNLRWLQQLEIIAVISFFQPAVPTKAHSCTLHQQSSAAIEKFGISMVFIKRTESQLQWCLWGSHFHFVFKMKLSYLELSCNTVKQADKVSFYYCFISVSFTCGRSQVAQLPMQNWYSLKNIIAFFFLKEQNYTGCNSFSVPVVSSIILA